MTEIDVRFLCRIQKADIVAEWEHTKARWSNGELSGKGEPDADIVPWVDRINQLPGICALQSCAGHKSDGYIEAAHFWLWLSRSVAGRFDRSAPVLSQRAQRIERVSKHYLSDGKEIAAITFQGNERGCLEWSAAVIYGYLCGIADVRD